MCNGPSTLYCIGEYSNVSTRTLLVLEKIGIDASLEFLLFLIFVETVI